MQVAKLFASLGFQVDDSQLVVFEKRLRDARHSTAMFARNLRLVNTNLRSVRTSMSNLNSTMAANANIDKANRRISGSFSNIRSNVNRVITVYQSLEKASNRLIPILNRVRGIVQRGSNAWRDYTFNAVIARDALRSFTQQMNAARAAASRTINVNINQNTRNGRGGTGSGGAGQLGALAGGAALLRPMIGGLAAGGALGAGVAIKEIVTAGREIQKMDNTLLVSSRNNAEYARSLQFVNKTANYLGVDIVELGNAYARTLQATQKKLGLDVTEKMFTGMGELMTTMQLNTEDQKGVFRAVTQMFTKGKVQAEEMLQIAERGLPALQLIREATKQVYKVDDKGFDKMQQKGLLDPAKILPVVAENMAKMARNNDALNKALNSSVAGQTRFKNSLKQMSAEMSKAGLEKSLNDLFNGLADLLDILKPLAVNAAKAASGITDLSKAIGTLVSDHKAFFTFVGGAILLFGRWRAASLLGGSAFSIFARMVSTGIVLMMKAWNRFPLLLLLTGLFEFGLAYRDHLKGKNTWVTVLINSLVILISTFRRMGYEFETSLLNMKIKWLEFQRGIGIVPEIGKGLQSPRQAMGQAATTLNPALTANPLFYLGNILYKGIQARNNMANQPMPNVAQSLNITIEPLTVRFPDGSTQKLNLNIGGAAIKR